MKTFQVKIRKTSLDVTDYLWNASNEYSSYYNSMLNELRIQDEINQELVKNGQERKFMSKYEMQKKFSAKALGHKPEYLQSQQIIDITDKLFASISSFIKLIKTDKTARPPTNYKEFDSNFNPLYFSFRQNTRTIKIISETKIELTFQNKKTIILEVIYNKKFKLSKLKFRGDGHKLIYKNGEFYFHFCIDEQKHLEPTNKSIFIDLGQTELVTGFCPETNEIITVAGTEQLMNKPLIAKKELIQSIRDKKKRGSIRYKKFQNRFFKLQRKETNQKHHYLHTISKRIVKNFDKIVVGDLTGIKKNTKSESSVTNKAKFQYWPVGLFVSYLDYKSFNFNRSFSKIDESNTTKQCCVCKSYKHMTLGDRVYECSKCGSKILRDVNSAINIYDRYMQVVPTLPILSTPSIESRKELLNVLKFSNLSMM